MFKNLNDKEKNTQKQETYQEKLARAAEILYPTMKDKYKKVSYENSGLENHNNEKLSPEDILYPTMSNKKSDMALTDGISKLDMSHDSKEEHINNTVLKGYISYDPSDKNFYNSIGTIFGHEGGYTNDPDDLGGPTKLGVTQSTYDWYNEKNNIPKQSVKNITKDEATKIYYDYFWKESGACNIKDKGFALMYFDAAVNHGPYYAKKYYKESKGDYNKFMELRKQHYKRMADNIPQQNENYKGWINRLNNMDKYIKKNY